MAEAYHEPERNPPGNRPKRQCISRKTVIEADKGTVPTLDLADLLCGPAGNRSGLRRIGDKRVGICPLPNCAANLPSFAVWPSTDSWKCFCCMRGGSVTDLARLAGDELLAKVRGR